MLTPWGQVYRQSREMPCWRTTIDCHDISINERTVLIVLVDSPWPKEKPLLLVLTLLLLTAQLILDILCLIGDWFIQAWIIHAFQEGVANDTRTSNLSV